MSHSTRHSDCGLSTRPGGGSTPPSCRRVRGSLLPNPGPSQVRRGWTTQTQSEHSSGGCGAIDSPLRQGSAQGHLGQHSPLVTKSPDSSSQWYHIALYPPNFLTVPLGPWPHQLAIHCVFSASVAAQSPPERDGSPANFWIARLRHAASYSCQETQSSGSPTLPCSP